jgi:hypothetical protein
VLARVTPEHISLAVQGLVQGELSEEPFGDSTEFDLIVETGSGYLQGRSSVLRLVWRWALHLSQSTFTSSIYATWAMLSFTGLAWASPRQQCCRVWLSIRQR